MNPEHLKLIDQAIQTESSFKAGMATFTTPFTVFEEQAYYAEWRVPEGVSAPNDFLYAVFPRKGPPRFFPDAETLLQNIEGIVQQRTFNTVLSEVRFETFVVAALTLIGTVGWLLGIQEGSYITTTGLGYLTGTALPRPKRSGSVKRP